MKETINNIHVISRGIIVSVVLHMIMVGFLVVTGFNTSLELFTGILLIVMGISGFYVGTISDRYAEINGLIIAIITSTIVLMYVAQYTEMDWAVNRIIIASYLVIGFLSSLISRLTNKKQKLKNKLLIDSEISNKTNNNEIVANSTKEPKKQSIFSFQKKQNKFDRRKIVEELKTQRENERTYPKKNS